MKGDDLQRATSASKSLRLRSHAGRFTIDREGRAVTDKLIQQLQECSAGAEGDGFNGRLMRKAAQALKTISTELSALKAGEPAATGWRCFQCDENFTDADSAALHFGTHQHQQPACQIDIAEYRAMEARMQSYNEEDAEIHRAMARMSTEHHTALQREEEKGYARGLGDAELASAPEALQLRIRNLEVVQSAAHGVSGRIKSAASELGFDPAGEDSALDHLIALSRNAAKATSTGVDSLLFEYRHPTTGESRIINVSRADVISKAPDVLYDKLGDEICNCQPLGETNVIECGCDDYIDGFELVTHGNAGATK